MNMTRRGLLAGAVLLPLRAQKRVFDVRDYGAAGDGKTLDTAAMQKAIDAAAAGVRAPSAPGAGAQVLVPGGKRYLVSTLVLKSGIDFHLADDAVLVVSTNQRDYPAGSDGVITATGAAGDGKTLDTAAIQKAIDAAAVGASSGPGAAAQVLVPGGKRYLVSTLMLKSGIDFHLADDAVLVVSTNQRDYPAGSDGVLTAKGAVGLKISGTGRIDGRAEQFMQSYSKEGEIWIPGEFRPKIFVLAACRDLEVRDITFAQAPQWGLHMLGCERVLVDGIKIRNNLDVPNCDGIDPDHCRDVEIRNCDIECGDDAIVVKATRQTADYGPSARISVHDCVLATKDSALKIGTETTADIYGIRFERCRVRSCCRGLTIQLRDEGNVYDVEFRDIEFAAQYQAAPWWGRGEAISLTAIPRTRETKVGRIHDVRIAEVRARAENSVRIEGTPESRIGDVTLDRLNLTMERWTSYPGGMFDNRPTSAYPEIEKHGTPAISLRYAEGVLVRDSKVQWGANRPDYFTRALEAEHVTGLALTRFSGEAAHPERDEAVVVR